MTQFGNVASLLVILFGVSEADAGVFIKVLMVIAGTISVGISWIGRWRKGDITLGGFRKA